MQTDYNKVENLLLAYPERFYNEYEGLVPFFDSLIEVIPNHIQLWIVTNNQSSIRKLKDQFSYKKLNTIGINGWDEIWLRDCIGFKKNGEILKPYYHPSYCEYNSDNHTSYFYKLNKLSKVIIRECITNKITNLPLRLDGGNFVNNGSLVLLTDKVLADNRALSKSEVIQLIKDFTGLQAIILPKNSSDNVGHADAYITFLNHHQVFLSNYPSLPFLKPDIEFLYTLRKTLEEEKLEVLEINDRPIDEAVQCNCHKKNRSVCFTSARGNYLNFLRLNNIVIIPEYTLPTAKETKYYNSINREILENQGLEVLGINCDQLSKLGGSLHCVSYAF